MSLADRRKHVDIVKKPIEILNLNNRFAHYLFNLKMVNSQDKNLARKVYIEVVDNSNPEHNAEYVLNKLSHSQLTYLESLQVIDYKEKKIPANKVAISARPNSLQDGLVIYEKTYHYRLKYLPEYYVEHPFYKHGYISANIYDHVICDSTKNACTVMGTESHTKILDYIKNRKYGNKVLKKVYEQCADEEKSDNEKFLEKALCDLCGKPVGIRPSLESKNRISWYIIRVK